MLQGGGALGSYQAGVYEALSTSDYLPNWVAGISIGAINAAIIAGNQPQDRVGQLRKFWEDVTLWSAAWPEAMTDHAHDWYRYLGAQSSVAFGQPGFFQPRYSFEWFLPDPPTSYYDTAPLKSTLEELVDFDLINSADHVRLSVGAVNVRTGQLTYFDTAHQKIGPEHIMASAALPPGLPSIEIDGEHYWDGGLVSNTPLAYVLDQSPRRSRLTFQVDVFQSYGQLPTTMESVRERDKDIRYASRTRMATAIAAQNHEVRHAINELIDRLPPEMAKLPEARRLYEMGCVTEMDVVQLIYRPFKPQGAAKTHEFSRLTMNERWDQGKMDSQATLLAAPWLADKPAEIGVRVFDVIHDSLVAKRDATQNKKRASVNTDQT